MFICQIHLHESADIECLGQNYAFYNTLDMVAHQGPATHLDEADDVGMQQQPVILNLPLDIACDLRSSTTEGLGSETNMDQLATETRPGCSLVRVPQV